jgi:undecaprenyl-diphosphatase
MVLVPILGEAMFDLLKGGFNAEHSGIPVLSLVIGFMAAFISGCIACRWMINIVKKGKLIYFAVYCAIAGTVTIVVSWL